VSAMTKLFDAWAHVDRSLRALVLESDTEPALGDQEQPA
jgi:hypothetical protein